MAPHVVTPPLGGIVTFTFRVRAAARLVRWLPIEGLIATGGNEKIPGTRWAPDPLITPITRFIKPFLLKVWVRVRNCSLWTFAVGKQVGKIAGFPVIAVIFVCSCSTLTPTTRYNTRKKAIWIYMGYIRMNNSSSLGLRMHTKRQSLVKSIGTNNLSFNQSTKTSWSVFAVTWALGHFN